MTLHTETRLFAEVYSPKGATAFCLSATLVLYRSSSLAGVCLLSEGGPSTVHVWHYGLLMKGLVAGVKPVGGVASEDGHRLELIRGCKKKEWKCLRSIRGMEIWQSVWLTWKPQDGEKERENEFRGFPQMAANYAVWFGPSINHHPHGCRNTLYGARLWCLCGCASVCTGSNCF